MQYWLLQKDSRSLRPAWQQLFPVLLIHLLKGLPPARSQIFRNLSSRGTEEAFWLTYHRVQISGSNLILRAQPFPQKLQHGNLKDRTYRFKCFWLQVLSSFLKVPSGRKVTVLFHGIRNNIQLPYPSFVSWKYLIPVSHLLRAQYNHTHLPNALFQMRLNFVQWQIQLRNWKIFFPLWKKSKFSKAKIKCCLHLSSSSSSRIPIWGWLKNFGSNFALTYTHLEILHQPQSCGACLNKATGFVERKTYWILVFTGTTVTAFHVSLPLGLLGERGRRKATENKNIFPHMRCVSIKTQGWSRLLALTTLMLEYSRLANFAMILHLWEPAFGEALKMPWIPPLTGSLPDWDPANLTSHGRQESTAVSLHGAGKHRQPQFCRGSPPLASLGTMLLPQEGYKLGGRLLGPTPIAGKHSECFLEVFWVY